MFIFSCNIAIAANENCSYYLREEIRRGCLEKKNDSSDYLTHYGYFYCKKFEHLKSQTKNKKLEKFIKYTRSCLQGFLKEKKDKPIRCISLENYAFDTHPTCYVKGRFCELGIKEKLNVLSLVAGINLFSKIEKSLLQYLKIHKKCFDGREYAGIVESFKIIVEYKEDLKALGFNKIKEIFFSIPQTSEKIVDFFTKAVSILKYGQSSNENDFLSKQYLKMKYTRGLSPRAERCFETPTEKCLKSQNIKKLQNMATGKTLETISFANAKRDDINIKLNEISKLK